MQGACMWKDCINLATNNLGLTKKNINNSGKHTLLQHRKVFMCATTIR